MDIYGEIEEIHWKLLATILNLAPCRTPSAYVVGDTDPIWQRRTTFRLFSRQRPVYEGADHGFQIEIHLKW